MLNFCDSKSKLSSAGVNEKNHPCEVWMLIIRFEDLMRLVGRITELTDTADHRDPRAQQAQHGAKQSLGSPVPAAQYSTRCLDALLKDAEALLRMFSARICRCLITEGLAIKRNPTGAQVDVRCGGSVEVQWGCW